MKIRRALKNMQKSGLLEVLEEYTLDNFKTPHDWQKNAKDKAIKFINNPVGWFGMFGQVGSGKTFLCTAICGEFLRQGREVKYMAWKDESTRLKALITEDDYQDEIDKFKTSEVLYIDDLFKTEKGVQPSKGDKNLAFELLNYRYNNRSLITILSSERLADEMIDIDEATGSRIYQRCKDYCINIGYDTGKNWRLK